MSRETVEIFGCNAIDASAGWLRVHRHGSSVVTIPWSSVTGAGCHVTKGSDLLWIEHEEGQIRSKIDHADPKRDALLKKLEEELGERWKGSAKAPRIDASRAQATADRKRSWKIIASFFIAFILAAPISSGVMWALHGYDPLEEMHLSNDAHGVIIAAVMLGGLGVGIFMIKKILDLVF
jgi:hypothetical protein